MLRQSLPLAAGVLGRIVRPRVSRVTIPITYDCHQKCKTCDIWKINKENPDLRKAEMKLEEFEAFCSVNDLFWIALTGGEPFLQKDIVGILKAALTYSKLVSITTTGFSSKKIEKDICQGLVSSSAVLALNVSFEGPKCLHDEITGVKGSYQRALDTYKRLLLTSEAQDGRLRVGISYTTSSYNIGKLDEFMEDVEREVPGVPRLTYGIAQDSPSYYQSESHRIKVAPPSTEVESLVRKMLPTLGKGPFDWVNRKYLEGLVDGHKPQCVAGQYSLMLDPYWNVYPCMFFCPDVPVGNLREVDFDLGKLDLTRCREEVKNCRIPCWTPCEAYSTIVFRPWRVL